jgi:transposase InsO family protein
MSYSSNPLLPKARAQAVRLVVEQGMSPTIAARKSGIHRTTLWRWLRKWQNLNKNVQLTNDNRPGRRKDARVPSGFRLAACTWNIPTNSSRPHYFGRTVSGAVIDRIRFFRAKYNRCAVVVHAYCKQEGTVVSLSTVRRVLYRLGLVVRKKWQRKWRPPLPRPAAERPGDFVQTDTVHLYDHRTKKRSYLYTVIDVCTRWAYAEYSTVLSQDIAADVIQRGQAYAQFHFRVVQADNGPEFSRCFEELLQAQGTTVRHSRVRRPNDNAHIERFNRTIQEECVGSTNPFSDELHGKVANYLAYYNEERLHLSLQCETPANVAKVLN